ncbi:hypothetical protein N7475_002756, partial [Penicillium sp. IBT 31633x]
MKLTIFFPLAAFLSWAVADSNVEASPCLLGCLSTAAEAAGCVSDDYSCTCPSVVFKDTLGACMETSCTAADLEVAGELHKERCETTPEE